VRLGIFAILSFSVNISYIKISFKTNFIYLIIQIYKMAASHMTGILSDLDILENLGSKVIISPFNKEQLQPNSYDVTLGPYYYKPGANRNSVFCIDNPSHIAKYWGLTPTPEDHFGALNAELINTKEDAEKYGVNIGDEIIVIEPGITILAHTNEFIGGVVNVTSEMKARSSTGRCAVSVAMCAGHGDVSFYNRYTLEVKNHGLDPIVLKVGLRLAQVVFHWCGDVINPYTKKGQYQNSDNLLELIRDWNPTLMVPSSAIRYMKDVTAKLIDKN